MAGGNTVVGCIVGWWLIEGLRRLFFEAEGLFDAVQVGVREQPLVLETADDDARGDTEFGGESFDALCAETAELTESSQLVFWNEEFGGEGVGLLLLAEGLLIVGAVLSFDKDVAFAVLEDVGAFVEEGEPEKIVFFATEAELEDRFGGVSQRVAP